ncbi:MAG: hypothetical protein AAF327_17645 [Cyanobacteria bacterium P01_A01_bin.37]
MPTRLGATALHYPYTLVLANIKQVQHIPDSRYENWAENGDRPVFQQH